MAGGKKLLPPPNLEESIANYSDNTWSTNNNGSSYAELLPPPPPANGTFAGSGSPFIDPSYLNEYHEVDETYRGFDITFAPGTPQREPSNRTFAPVAAASVQDETPKTSKKRRREDTRDEPNMYEQSKQLIVDPNMPVQAKLGSLTTIEGLINANCQMDNLASLVEEFFIMELGRLLWDNLEPIGPICGTILNVLSKIIEYGGKDLVKKHVKIPLQKLTEKRDIINKANELLTLLPNA